MNNGTISDKAKEKEEEPIKRPVKAITVRIKEFRERNCLIDELMETKEGIIAFRIIIFILFSLVAQTASYDYFYKGEINLGQRLILLGLTNFHKFWLVWFTLFLSNFLVYYGLKCWATVRTGLAPKSSSIRKWDYFWLALTVLFYPGWLTFATWISLNQGMKICLQLAIFSEITRMLMKIHAFIRSNVPRVLNYKPHCDNDVLYPNISHFVYFLWVPTLIYRDSYPRTKNIRWNYVGFKALEFAVALLLTSVTIERYFIAGFEDYGTKSYTWGNIAVKIVENASGGMIIMVTIFYIILDLWQCSFAEICRFADRQFYQDWWTSISYERYHRTWNVVVHDWLYTYVYAEFYKTILPGNRIAAKYTVFFLSALFHEYVLAFSFGFFLPIVLILFLFLGSFVAFPKMKPEILSNAVFLYTIGLGNAINCSFYAIEYFARLNCPVEDSTFTSYLIPRMFSCNSS